MVFSKFYKRIAALFCAFCCFVLCFAVTSPSSVFAEEVGSILVTSKAGSTIVEGMQWNLYHVGSRNENYYSIMEKNAKQIEQSKSSGIVVKEPNVYHTEGQFAGTPVMLNVLNDNAALTLENEAVLGGYTPDMTSYSDANGNVLFDQIPEGLYLLSGKRLKVGQYTYCPSPALIEVIHDSQHNNLNVKALPKIKVLDTLNETVYKYTARKVWLNEDANANRPVYITLNVYKDGQYFTSAVLNESNNWEMTWEGSNMAEWRVEEAQVPANYTVVYLSNETQFVVENTYTPWYNSSSFNDEWEGEETTIPPSLTDTGEQGTTTDKTPGETAPATTTKGGEGNNNSDISTTTTKSGNDNSDVSTTTTKKGNDGSDASTTTATKGGSDNHSSTTTTKGGSGNNGSTTTTTTTKGGNGSGSEGPSGSGNGSGGSDGSVTTTTTTNGGGSGNGSGSGSNSSSGSGSGSSSGGNSGSGSGGSSGGSSGNSSSITKLPQTGQLWWPLPFLGLGGIICIMIGWQIYQREE